MRTTVRAKIKHRLVNRATTFLSERHTARAALQKILSQAQCQNFHDDLHHIKHVVRSVSTVIDVGAHHGKFSKAAATVFSPETILALEPNVDLHSEIRRNCPTAQVLPYALASTPGDGYIYKHADSSMTSLLPTGAGYADNYVSDPIDKIQRVPVRIRTLADFVDEAQLSQRSTLLKLDTQGNELDVLMSGGNSIQACSAIIVEYMFWSGYNGRASFADTVRYLDTNSFELIMVCNMRFRKNGSPAVADFVFAPRA